MVRTPSSTQKSENRPASTDSLTTRRTISFPLSSTALYHLEDSTNSVLGARPGGSEKRSKLSFTDSSRIHRLTASTNSLPSITPPSLPKRSGIATLVQVYQFPKRFIRSVGVFSEVLNVF